MGQDMAPNWVVAVPNSMQIIAYEVSSALPLGEIKQSLHTHNIDEVNVLDGFQIEPPQIPIAGRYSE